MFIRTKKVKGKGGKTYEYEQLVETYRIDGKVKQRIVLTIGKKGENSNDRVEQIIKTLMKKDPTLELVRQFDQKASDVKIHRSKIYGSYLVFRHLWKKLHIGNAMRRIAPKGNRDQFEEMIFLMTLARLHDPASERKMLKIFEPKIYHNLKNTPQLNRWYEAIERMQSKRAEIEKIIADHLTGFLKDDFRLLYLDTTTLVLFGEYRSSELAKYGHSKEKRRDKKQVIVGLVVGPERIPVGITEASGNEADVNTFVKMLEQMEKKYQADKMVFVGDKGMNSKHNRAELVKLGKEYILGVRACSEKKVKEAVAEIYFDKAEKLPFSKNQKKLLKKLDSQGDDDDFRSKVVEKDIGNRRMVFMLNPFEKAYEKKKRDKIVKILQNKVQKASGIKELIGNKAYRSMLKFADIDTDELVKIDEEKLKEIAKFDGITVIETNSDLSAVEVAKQYKQLITVEQSFSDLKTMLNTAPIYHKTDINIKGHIFINFLALTLYATLFHSLGNTFEDKHRYEIMNSISEIQAHLVEQNGRKYWVRTELTPTFRNICSLLKLKVPPRILGA